MSNLKTLKQVAPILNVKPVTLYRLCKNREIPYRKVGCKIMFTDEDVEKYLSSTFVEPTTAGGAKCNSRKFTIKHNLPKFSVLVPNQ